MTKTGLITAAAAAMILTGCGTTADTVQPVPVVQVPAAAPVDEGCYGDKLCYKPRKRRHPVKRAVKKTAAKLKAKADAW
jgi:hypothetical protein